MNKAAPPPKTVLETILEWSNGRPLWQRDALRRIISKGKLNDTDIKELVEICKQIVSGKSAGTPLDKTHLPANPGQGASISLTAIADIAGTNNLAPGQKLEFEPKGITVIYGDNGAGKSGYVRILKRACRARHSDEIHPNIYAEEEPPPASATISYNIGDKPQKPENWQDTDSPHPILSAASVFDSDCADVHIGEKNEVAFRPFGLDVPDELAGTCQAVKEAISAQQKLQEKARNPIFLRPVWKDFTRAGKVLSSLKADTDIQFIRTLGTLTDQERARLVRLKEDLSKDPAKAAAEQKLKADNIGRLRAAVQGIETQTTDAALAEVFSLGKDAKSKREAAKIAAEKAFSGESLRGIGGETWRALWESARRYSTQTAYPDQPFPPATKDTLCVLCQQPVEDDALARMTAFDEFVKKDAEQQAQQAEAASQEAIRKLRAITISIRPIKASLQEAALHKPETVQQALRSIAAARMRRYATMKALVEAEKLGLPAAAPSAVAAIQQLEAGIRNYSAELQKSAAGEERKKLELELTELSDRSTLGDMLQVVEDEITRLRNIEFLGKCIAETTTTAITKIGNEIADTVITPKLRDRFQEEIVKLAAEKVRVEIVRSGGKHGSPQYQVRLFAKPEAEVTAILSEGEQTCVALAAFMTELATATHRSALVFDDPVCSLDHRWRKQVAKRLVEESEKRQVIVFTHDLVFVNDLLDLAEANGRPVKPVNIQRGAAGTGIVAEGMPWVAQRVEDRIDKLEKAIRIVKQLHDKNQDQEYRKEAASIYSQLRASWERALEDIAFFRVVQRHRDYIDTKNLKKVSVLTDADCDAFHAGFKKCCDFVDAHDPSSGRNPEAPPPTEIEQDIQALKTWVIGLRDRQKKVA